MLRLDSRFTPRLKELTQTFMPEHSDHASNCNLSRYGIQAGNPTWENSGPPENRDQSLSGWSRFHSSTKEACGIEGLAPERRGPHPTSEEGKLELTEALRSNDRS